MSVQAIRWAVRQTTGSATAKAVLIVLAEAADESGYTYIGHDEIGRRAEVTTRAVISQMKRLSDAGLIERSRRYDARGWRTSNGVNLCLNRVSQGEAASHRPKVNDVHLGAVLSEPDDVSKVNLTTVQGERGSPEPLVEPLEEPKKEADEQQKPSRKAAMDAFTDSLWKLASRQSRQRSSPLSLSQAVNGALKRGHLAENIETGVRAYFASDDARKEGGKFAMGVHRLLRDDRWQPYLPERSAAPGVRPEDPWRARLREYATNQFWNGTDWGPKPGKPECLAPTALLAEFGYVAGVVPLARKASPA